MQIRVLNQLRFYNELQNIMWWVKEISKIYWNVVLNDSPLAILLFVLDRIDWLELTVLVQEFLLQHTLKLFNFILYCIKGLISNIHYGPICAICVMDNIVSTNLCKLWHNSRAAIFLRWTVIYLWTLNTNDTIIILIAVANTLNLEW